MRRSRRENIGFIFQAHNLIPFLNARDNTAIAMEINGVHWKAARKRALELLDYLYLSNRSSALPKILSGGEQQNTIITVTHDIRMIEGFDTIYHIVAGRLFVDDTATISTTA